MDHDAPTSSSLKVLLELDEPKPGSAGGAVTPCANHEQIGVGRLDRSIPIGPSSYAGMDMGRDNGLVVDRDYDGRAPYPFTGTLRNVTFDLRPARTNDDEKVLHEHASIHVVAHGVSA